MNAIIMSGGGAKGAFTVGALKYLSGKGLLDDLDLISGTSTGSLIAAMYCAGEIKVLEDVYRNVEQDDILWYSSIPENIMEKNTWLFDTTPLRRVIAGRVTQNVFDAIMNKPTELFLTAVNLQTGAPTVFSSKAVTEHQGQFDVIQMSTRPLLLKALEASSNQGVLMPPVRIEIGQEKYDFVDGGHREVLPTMIVRHRIEQRKDPANRVFLISNNPMTLMRGKDEYTNLADVLMRIINIFVQDVRDNDIASLRGIPNVETILICPGDRDIDEDYSTGLRFNSTLMGDWMDFGQIRAEEEMNKVAARDALVGK
ncbi:MAG TPA: patatin-like phospholipase family protein [Flavobacteriales bacterium]|nr:patatin-like phospholipase family protein [Flavobacteriales bacterium]